MLASDWQYHDILDISPYEGVMPSPHRGTKIPNMTLEWARPIQIHSLILTEFPVKFSARLINFKALIEKILAYPRTANRRLYFHILGPHITQMTPLVHQM